MSQDNQEQEREQENACILTTLGIVFALSLGYYLVQVSLFAYKAFLVASVLLAALAAVFFILKLFQINIAFYKGIYRFFTRHSDS